MASESASPELPSTNSNVSQLLPLLLALAGQDGPSMIATSSRVIFINPDTQSLMVVEGTGSRESGGSGGSGGSGIEAMLQDLLLGEKSGEPPASEKSIEAMVEKEVTESGKDCVICLEEFPVGGMAKQMPCNHCFHGECVEKWLRVHGTCPVCRYRMPEEEKAGGGGEATENSGGVRREIWVSNTVRNPASNGSSSVDEPVSASPMLDDLD